MLRDVNAKHCVARLRLKKICEESEGVDGMRVSPVALIYFNTFTWLENLNRSISIGLGLCCQVTDIFVSTFAKKTRFSI